eukprot:c25984_g1_i1 orf=709-2112(+)
MGTEILEHRGTPEEPRQGLSDDEGAPDSWDTADLEERMKKLMPSSLCEIKDSTNCKEGGVFAIEKTGSPASAHTVGDGSVGSVSNGTLLVDNFLKEALQNSRDRLTILRLEQEVERFMRNQKQQQLEFQPMPSSYLRLVAHRVAQHYCLKSMVVDSNTPEGIRIIAQKTSESRFPVVRLADIPVNQPQGEKSDVMPSVKVMIKPSRQKLATRNCNCNAVDEFAVELNRTKSVEERKEEYNIARARIFTGGDLVGRSTEEEALMQDNSQNMSSPFLTTKVDGKWTSNISPDPAARGSLSEKAVGMCNDNSERGSTSRVKMNSSRVAILRDREKDRKDPDYDRTYERYMQRFDPGFGVNLGALNMQAIYSPVVNYNTEFPQLGGPMCPHIHVEQPSLCPGPLHLQGAWVDSFNPGHMGSQSGSAVYLHRPQFACPHPTIPYINSQDHFQQTHSQHSMQHEGGFNQARRF